MVGVMFLGLLACGQGGWGERSFLGNFLRLSILIFFVNYFCLHNKLSILIAISFWF